MFTEEIIREVLAAMKVCTNRFHQSSLQAFSKTELMLPERPYLYSSLQFVDSSLRPISELKCMDASYRSSLTFFYYELYKLDTSFLFCKSRIE